MISENLVTGKNLNASVIIRELAKNIQGGGGGQPFYATAGGKNPEGLDMAFEKAKNILAKIHFDEYGNCPAAADSSSCRCGNAHSPGTSRIFCVALGADVISNRRFGRSLPRLVVSRFIGIAEFKRAGLHGSAVSCVVAAHKFARTVAFPEGDFAAGSAAFARASGL